MLTLKEKLRKLLDERGRGAKTNLAKHLGVSPVYVSRYSEENYPDVNMPRKHIFETAKFFNVNADYLLGNNSNRIVVRQVPIVGNASCGASDVNMLQDITLKANYNGEYWNEKLYCVIANGDSMATDIEDGDELICDPDAEIKNGDFVHYQINGESAVKLFNKDEYNNLIEFIPFNSTSIFKTRVIRLESDEIENLQMAKVVSINKIQLNNRLARLKKVGR